MSKQVVLLFPKSLGGTEEQLTHRITISVEGVERGGRGQKQLTRTSKESRSA